MKEAASIKRNRICRLLHYKHIFSGINNPEICCRAYRREVDNKKFQPLSSVH